MKRIKVRQLILNVFVWLATEIILTLLGLDDMADYGEYLNQQHFLIGQEAQKYRKRPQLLVCCQSRCCQAGSGVTYGARKGTAVQRVWQDLLEVKQVECMHRCSHDRHEWTIADEFPQTDSQHTRVLPKLPTTATARPLIGKVQLA
ncbi:MAG: hypothetical protein SWY16_09060 [Cyanobacteriota bacterium]|nr:hypothetical protein [Cyanobacteriota bacterium]